MSNWTWRTMVLLWTSGILLGLAAGKVFVVLDNHWLNKAEKQEAAIAEAKGVDLSGHGGIIGVDLTLEEARVLNRAPRLTRLAAGVFACVIVAELMTLLVLTVVWVWGRFGN